jgi:hypothetical protein
VLPLKSNTGASVEDLHTTMIVPNDTTANLATSTSLSIFSLKVRDLISTTLPTSPLLCYLLKKKVAILCNHCQRNDVALTRISLSSVICADECQGRPSKRQKQMLANHTLTPCLHRLQHQYQHPLPAPPLPTTTTTSFPVP